MPKVRRGGYVFIARRSDHAPRHVHVYRNGRFVVKWDLEGWRAMRGLAPGRLVRIIRTLEQEGLM